MPSALDAFEKNVFEENSEDYFDLMTNEDEAGNSQDGFFPKTPDLRRRRHSSLGLSSNLRNKFRPRDNIAMMGDMELLTSAQHRDKAGLGGFRSASVKPRHHLKANGEIDLTTTNLESFKERRAQSQRSGIEKPRHHLSATGILDLKTTTSENFKSTGRPDRAEKIDRNNLKLSGELSLRTTNKDYKHYGEVASSEIRAEPPWFIQQHHNPIIIS